MQNKETLAQCKKHWRFWILKANSQINAITFYVFPLGNEAYLSASRIFFPGFVFSEKVLPGLCLGLMNTGSLLPERWYPVTASALIESRFFFSCLGSSAGLPGMVKPNMPGKKPCWQHGHSATANVSATGLGGLEKHWALGWSTDNFEGWM